MFTAISFSAPEQKRDIFTIEKLIRTRLPIRSLPKMDKIIVAPKEASRKRDFSNRARPSNNFHSKKHRHQPFKRSW